MQMPLAFGILLVFTALHGQENGAVQACDHDRLQMCVKTLWFASAKDASEEVCSFFMASISCLEKELSNCPEYLQTQMAKVLKGSRETYSSKCSEFANTTHGNQSHCSDVVSCLSDTQGMRDELLEILEDYRIGEIYGNLGSWCSNQTQCLDNTCDDEDIVAYVTFAEGVLAKMCSERENCRDTSCYQGDFRERMFGCHSDWEGLDPNNVQEFKICINNALGELPGCSRDNFFYRFISFVADLFVKANH